MEVFEFYVAVVDLDVRIRPFPVPGVVEVHGAPSGCLVRRGVGVSHDEAGEPKFHVRFSGLCVDLLDRFGILFPFEVGARLLFEAFGAHPEKASCGPVYPSQEAT